MVKASKSILKNDYERMVPEFHRGSNIYGEHIVRYYSAQTLVENKIVLDIASGSGYGTKLLSEKAKKVYGIDVSSDSVEYARQNYHAKNVKYIVGDGESISLKDNSVDVVVTFETIEHIKDYKTFLQEISRVLKPDGLLLISTPNDLEFAEGNHFHLHEFEYEELKNLLLQFYKYVDSYFQGTWIYNAIVPEINMSKEIEFKPRTINVAPINKEKCIYFYLLCSNRKIIEKPEPIAAISEHWSAKRLQEEQEMQQQSQTLLTKQYEDIEELIRQAKETHKNLKDAYMQINKMQKLPPYIFIRIAKKLKGRFFAK